jgi:phosphate transport system protein
MSHPQASGSPDRQTGFRHFHEQLSDLKQRLLDMSEKAEALIDLAVESLRERDVGKAEAVVAADHELDDLELEVEQRAIALLALQQPMARDLRFIVGAIKISSDLERVGDHAVNIAQCTLRLRGVSTQLAPGLEIDEMARRAREMLGDALDAFIRADGTLGRSVCRRDDEVDALEETTFRVLLTHMMESPSTISSALQLLLVSRNLERVADLATNIGEDAVYLAEGKQIKHHFEERQLSPLDQSKS